MKTVFVVYIALLVLALSACQKQKDTEATAPGMNAQCVNNPNLCQSNVYNAPGFTPYNYGNTGYGSYGNYGGGYSYNDPFNYYQNNSAFLCNCSSGLVPTYNSYAGLGCVQQSQVNSGAYAYFSWGIDNNQWTNIPQVSNVSGYSNSGCYNGVVQSCLVGQANTCSIGFTCRTNDASSHLGLCVSNSTATNSSGGYGPPVR